MSNPPNADIIAMILAEHGVADAPYLAVKIAETFDGNTLRSALEQIATGEIAGESRNYRDALSICRDIAREALGLIHDIRTGGNDEH